jgi:TPR repeat protein
MNSIESAHQYVSVAESGDAQAQFTLALMYANGHGGLDKDYMLAYKWATMAAMNGNVESAMLAELLIPQMSHQTIEESKKMIRLCRSNKL